MVAIKLLVTYLKPLMQKTGSLIYAIFQLKNLSTVVMIVVNFQ